MTINDEETPLLNAVDVAVSPALAQSQSTQKERTPLPKLQMGIALLLIICEPVMYSSIYPYINKLVSELDVTGGDETKTGYYAGLIESLFFLTQSLTIFYWTQLSDKIGRKPVVLFGTCSMIISMVSFGLSRTFLLLVVSRSLVGAVNGNIGVFKTMFGDLTDSTNRADAFVLFPVSYAFGSTIGPYIGGALAKPHEQFPDSEFFSRQFWIDYPYSLPCLVTAGWTFVVLLIVACFLKETNPRLTKRFNGDNANQTTEASEDHSTQHSVSSLLKHRPIIFTMTSYAFLAFLETALWVMLPLFMAMPISMGGLSLEPRTIGGILGTLGLVAGSLQFVIFPRLVRRLHERKVFMISMTALGIAFMMMPIINHAARKDGGMSTTVWALISILLLLAPLIDLGFGAIHIYLTTATPTPSALGATNGLGQTAASIVRTIAPALATSTWALAAQKNWIGGWGIYLIWSGMACVAFWWACKLPKKNWQEPEEE